MAFSHCSELKQYKYNTSEDKYVLENIYTIAH